MGDYQRALASQHQAVEWLSSENNILRLLEESEIVEMGPNHKYSKDETIESFWMETLYTLSGGSTFYCSKQIAEMIHHAAQTLPEWKLEQVLMPKKIGFLWIDEPIHLVNDGTGKPLDVTSFSWSEHIGGKFSGIIFTVYAKSKKCPAIPFLSMFWSYGVTSDKSIAGMQTDDWKEVALRECASFFCALLLFMQQELFATTQERVNRQMMRHAPKIYDGDSTVQVIYLRRKSQKHTGESEPQEWAYQWVVSGHWRQQWYPSANQHRPIWIHPYFKGPEDKPLKMPNKKVYAIVQ